MVERNCRIVFRWTVLCLPAKIECERPNDNLRKFEGNLTWNEQIYPLKNDNLLLRGTRLRNTQWAFGSKEKVFGDSSLWFWMLVVCYAGRDTKLMQNSGKPKFKRTKIDHWLNKIIIGASSLEWKFRTFSLWFVDFCLLVRHVFDHRYLFGILGISHRFTISSVSSMGNVYFIRCTNGRNTNGSIEVFFLCYSVEYRRTNIIIY